MDRIIGKLEQVEQDRIVVNGVTYKIKIPCDSLDRLFAQLFELVAIEATGSDCLTILIGKEPTKH